MLHTLKFFLGLTFKRRRWACFALLSLGFAACGGAPKHRDFVVAMESFANNLDPRFSNDAYAAKVQSLIFNGLLKFDDNLALVPDLAESYKFLSDRRMRFILRKGVVFHNGKPLSSADVVYTLKTLMDPNTKSQLFSTFNRIAELEAVDDRTLEIELKDPFVPFLTALTVGILPEGADDPKKFAQPFSEHPIGTGPFAFEESRKDQWIRLRSNPQFYNGAPDIASLKIQTIRDDTTRVLQMLHGEVDLVQNGIPLVMADWLKGKQGLQMQSDVGINYVYLAFNLKDPLLQDQRVREAIALSIDRNKLIEFRMKGFARPATGLLAPSNAYYDGDVQVFNFDPELAKHILDQAGFPDPDGPGPKPRLTLTLKTSNKRDRVAMARAIARQLADVGIELKVQAFEWGTFFQDIRTGNFQAFTSTWVGVTDPDIYYNAFDSESFPPDGANRGYYKNPEIDKLLEQARAELEVGRRKKIYAKVQKILAQEVPYVSLWYEDNVAFTQKDVEGYKLRPDASLIGLTKASKTQATEVKNADSRD